MEGSLATRASAPAELSERQRSLPTYGTPASPYVSGTVTEQVRSIVFLPCVAREPHKKQAKALPPYKRLPINIIGCDW